MYHIKARDHWGEEEAKKLELQLLDMFNAAPESPSKNSEIFKEKSNKQRISTYRTSQGVYVRARNPKPLKDEKIVIKIGTTEYRVYNTKAHIRILAERLGIELVKPVYKLMSVWVGVNGYNLKSTKAKVKLYKHEDGYLPIYFDGSKNYYYLFKGKLFLASDHKYSAPDSRTQSFIEGLIINAASVSTLKRLITTEIMKAVKKGGDV